MDDDIKQTNIELYTSLMADKGVDASPGTSVYGLVVEPAAELSSFVEQAFRDILDNLDISTAEDEYATALLSNLGLYERSAGIGKGSLIIVVSSGEDVVIRQSTYFTAGSYRIVLNRDYIGSTDTGDLSDSVYVPLMKYDDNNYYMIVEGETVEDITTPLLAGTPTSALIDIENLVQIKTATEFKSSVSPVSLDDLRDSVASGVASKTLGGAEQIKALLTSEETLGVSDVSVVGMGDIEMTRDHDASYGAGSGGCVDIYIRTAGYPEKMVIRKTAVAVSDNLYKIFIDRREAPGFYMVSSMSYVESASKVDNGTISLEFGADVSGVERPPRFHKPIDARYSAFQNCEIRFECPAVVGDSLLFDVELLVLPGVSTVCDYVRDPAIRDAASDYLVRAAIPCLLNVEVRISHEASAQAPDPHVIATQVTAAVNASAMGRGFLSGAELAEAVTAVYPDVVVKLPVVIEALTVLPSGSLHYQRSTDTFRLPELPDMGVGHKTVALFLKPDDVSVKISGDLL